MGLEFITRTFKTTAILAAVVALYLFMYTGGRMGLGFLVGVVWSLINFYLLKRLITELITPAETRKDIAVVLGMLKFPILYGVGYLIVASDYFSIYMLLAGFSLIFLVMLLKVLARLILRLDTFGFEKKHVEGTP